MKQEIVLLEGADNCGKSTIGHALSAATGIPYFKNGNEHRAFQGHQTHLLTRYAGLTMAEFLQQTRNSAIFDRSYPSEYAYGHAFNREVEHDIIRRLDEMHAQMRAVIVYCFKRGYRHLDDDLISICVVAAIRQSFRQSFDI